MTVDFIQIIYDESQREKCYPFADVYFNYGLTIFFENSVIENVVLASKSDKISVCSWRLKEKMKYYIGKPREITLELLKTDYEVLSFTRNTQYHRMIESAERWHPGFRSTMSKIMAKIGQPMVNEVKNPIYQNHFAASRGTYQDYVKHYLVPAMQCMESDLEINRLIMQDANYSKLKGVKQDELEGIKNNIGINYYPMAPFILERLFSIYVQNKKINVTCL